MKIIIIIINNHSRDSCARCICKNLSKNKSILEEKCKKKLSLLTSFYVNLLRKIYVDLRQDKQQQRCVRIYAITSKIQTKRV